MYSFYIFKLFFNKLYICIYFSSLSKISETEIINVYKDNVEQAINEISSIITTYPIIGIDTEFPGFFSDTTYVNAMAGKLPYPTISGSYQRFIANIDNLKLIQLGLAFMSPDGKLYSKAYQFNFQYDVEKSLHVDSSIQLLVEHGMNFQDFKTKGISPIEFSYLFIISGMLQNKQLSWIFFHGSCDLAYLVKAVTLQNMPASFPEFKKLYQKLFPNTYDIKKIWSGEGSLASCMQQYGVSREGEAHQAGSDAIGTVEVFMKMKKENSQNVAKRIGCIYEIDEME